MSRWFEIIGWVILPGAAALTGRLVWEQTWLTWKHGLQMIGFTLVHVYVPFFLFGMICILLAHVWLLARLIQFARRGASGNGRQILLCVLLLLAAGLQWVPYGTWQWLMIKAVGPGSHGEDFLTTGAATKEYRVVQAALSAGVKIDAVTDEGNTALHIAADRGDERMIKLLLARGANPHLRNGSGQTPALRAFLAGHKDLIRIFPTEAQPKELPIEVPGQSIVVTPEPGKVR